MKQAETCLVITDHAAGNQRQALALAHALDIDFRHLQLQPKPPWSWLAPRLLAGGRHALPREFQALFAPPWPQLAIGCGRMAALWTRMLGQLSGGACYTVQILDPRIAPGHWNTVIAPQHDGLHGANVLNPLGSLNPVDEVWLAEARRAWPQLERLPSPRLGVLLGGPRRGIALGPEYGDALAQRLLARQRAHGGSLLVTASRRTPDSLMAALRQRLHPAIPALLWRNAGDGPNPYPGILAWSHALAVTPDSVNMLSEACAAGCPVYTYGAAPLPPKIAAFHRRLRDRGLLHDLDDLSPPGCVPPLRETAAVAQIVRERLAAHTRAG